MGRLIDADFILNKMETTEAQPATYSERYAWEFATVLLNNAPTVEAIPTPKDATNGDILRTIFPKAKYELQKFYEEDTIVFDLDGFYMRISSDWWNSPYKENIENGKVD